MAIYNGTQKINMSGVDKVYVGTQLVYQKTEPMPDLYCNYYDGNAANTVSVKLNPTTKQFEPYTFTYPSGGEPGIYGSNIGSDGTNIYNSQNRSKQYVLNGDTWSNKTGNDTSIEAENICIFYSYNARCHVNSRIKELLSNGNGSTGTIPSVYSSMSGYNFFYDCIQKRWWGVSGSNAYYYDTSWHSTTNPISSSSGSFYGSIPGRNEMFYSLGTTQKRKTSSSWSNATGTGLPENITPSKLFYYNNNTYYIVGSKGSYVLYKLTSSYGGAQSNDFSLDYFNNNNKSINSGAQFGTTDLVKPCCAIQARYTTYKRFEE